jgi:hypothetical protein
VIIFSFELVIKLAGLGWEEYLDDNFNVLDATVVIVSWIELAG